MGQPLNPRIIRSGPYVPTVPRTGAEGGTIWRKRNLITRGRGNYYEEVIAAPRDTGASCPKLALSGTVTLTQGTTVVNGSGTFFHRECRLGQRILVEDTTRSELIVPVRIISDTQMEVARAVLNNYTNKTAYRLYRLFTLNDTVGAAAWGNAIQLDKGTLLSVGTGEMLINGISLSAALALLQRPQISIFDPSTGLYSHFPLGMNQPDPPGLTAVAGGTKGMQPGTYGVVITSGRSATGGYNNPSLAATVTIAAGERIEVDFPVEDSGNGSDVFQVWVTSFLDSLVADLNAFNGPWHFLQEVAVADLTGGSGGTFILEWLDAEVEGNETVSFNNDPPPEAEFIEFLDFKPVWIGCRGKGYVSNSVTYTDPAPGPFIAPAKPNNIEAAPADIQFSSSPPETIIGALAGEGRIYLMTVNNLQIAQATPQEAVPVLIRPYWRDGFGNPEALILVRRTLFGYPLGGPSRSSADGDPTESEKNWAADVWEITKNWNPYHVLLGYDPLYDCVIFFHTADRVNSSGFWTTRFLMYSAGQDMWVGDGEFSSTTHDSIVSGVATVGNELQLVMGGRGASTTPLYVFGDGTTAVNWWLVAQISDSGDDLRAKTIKSVRGLGKVTSPVFDIYGYGVGEGVNVTDLENGTNSKVTIAATTTTQVTQTQRYQINVKNALLHTVRLGGTFSGSGEKDRIDEIVYEQAMQGARVG